MNRSRVLFLAVSLLLVTAETVGAAVSADIEKLPFRREVLMVTDLDAAEDAWIEVIEDSLLAGKAHARFTDVRFMNEAGESIPYAGLVPNLTETLYFPYRAVAPEWRMIGGREECVIDLGTEHPALLSLDLPDGPGDPTLQITASADGDHWKHVSRGQRTTPRGSLISAPDPGLNLTFPERYLKIARDRRTRTTSAPIRILRYEERPTERESVAFTIVRSAFRNRTWQADIEFKGPERFMGALVLDVPRATPASLPIRLEAGRGESRRNAFIDRMPDWSQSPRDTLTFYPLRTGTLRITVEGADPPNVPFTVAEAHAVPYRWRLPVPSGRLWIACGDDFMEPRDWNLERDAERALIVAATRLGPVEDNPHHRPPGFGLEWLKRRPAVLSAAMVALLALVALLTLRRRPPAAPALLLMIASCAPPQESAPLTIWAAASLTDVLPRVADMARQPGEPPVRFTFDATSRLARQIEAGAPADLFFSADEAWMNEMVRRTAVDPASRTNLLGNDLVVVVPAASTLAAPSPGALRSEVFQRIGLADSAVPAGRYARAALIDLGLWPAMEERVVNGSNVRTVLAWVARGEVDAGIVYGSDAAAEPGVRTAFVFPDSSHAPIVYSAAITFGSKRTADARRFLEFCRSDPARSLFEAAGFRIL